jgi:ABC-type multidrug transport system fused ATPase/permease subunit
MHKQSTVRRLLHHFGQARWFFILALVFMLVDAACQSAVPLLFRSILNGLQAEPEAFLSQSLWPTITIAVGVTLVFIPAAYFGHALAQVSMARLLENLRVGLYGKVQGLSADFHQRHLIGESSARLNGDLDQTGVAIGAAIGMVWAMFSLLYAMAMMVWIDAQLSALFVTMFALASYATWRFLPIVRRMGRRVRDRAGDTSGVVTELLGVQSLIKSFTYEDSASHQVRKSAVDLRRAHEHLAWRQGLFNDGMQTFLKFVAPFALLIIGGFMVANGRLLIGDLVAFWGFWIIMTHALALICTTLPTMVVGLAAADRVMEWLDERPTVDDRSDAQELERATGALQFRDVSFAYPADDGRRLTLEHFNLDIPAGETVALVGPSGAGKSTILQMLLRFYDPKEGAITLDGTDLRAYTQRSLRQQIGVVFQENVFLAGTVAENLRVARRDASDADIRSALEQANAWEFIAALPDGIYTRIGERGARLSGGQKQRLAIARVFLKDPRIMLLDEATAALDASSEELVVEALDRLLEGRTAVIVAHRINTVRNADRIVVIDNGRPVAQGRHDELRQESAIYARFCAQQRVA